MTQFTANEVLRKLRERFTSGNSVPVPDVRLTRAEFDAFADLLEAQAKAVPVVWVSPDDLANPYFVGIGAAKEAHQDLGKHYTLPLYTQSQPPAARVPDIETMVNRFLSWRLPKPWNPDNGISYTRPNYAHEPAEHDWPTGTNLFDAHQAREMIEYMLAAQENPNGV